MIRRLLRSGPKYFISAVVSIVAVTGFCLWLFVWRTKPKIRTPTPVVAVDNSAKVAKIEADAGKLILVDNDLYEVATGELVFKAWLKDGMPAKLFWEPESKTILAQYELGFVRYRLDGTEQASLQLKYQFGIDDDYKWIVFAKGNDIWRADVDWKSLTLTNERMLTSIGQFNDANFAGNIVLGTDKTLIVRNLNKVLQVNMETGRVKPMDFSLEQIAKRKSPDSKNVVGLEKGQFYCYEVDTDHPDMHPVGRGAVNDYQWLDNDRCVAIAAMKIVILYDRKGHSLTDLVALSSMCNRIGEPSPDGHFVFCTGRGNGLLVDVEKKTAIPIVAGAGVTWVSEGAFAFSRDMPDSDLRGTWLEKAGEGERRVSHEPYLVNNRGDGFIMPVPKAGVVVFATKLGLSRMKPDGSEVADVVKLAHAPERVLGIQDWKLK